MLWKHPIPHLKPLQDRVAERRAAPESGPGVRLTGVLFLAKQPKQCGRILAGENGRGLGGGGCCTGVGCAACVLTRFCVFCHVCLYVLRYLIMTDAAVRMCVTRESSREEEVRESRREVLLASAGRREIVRAHTSARDGCLL